MAEKDLCSKETLLRKAESGDCEAQYQLGILCLGREEMVGYRGELWWRTKPQSALPKEKYDEGIAWLEKAAEQGLIKAQNALGNFYIDGVSVIKSGASYRIMKRNVERGLHWYTVAAEHGDKFAAGRLGKFYSDEEDKPHKPCEFDIAKAEYWLQRAEKYWQLATLFDEYTEFRDDEILKHYDKALKYYKLAFDNRDKDIYYGEFFDNCKETMEDIGYEKTYIINRISHSLLSKDEAIKEIDWDITSYKYLSEKYELGYKAYIKEIKALLEDEICGLMKIEAVCKSNADGDALTEQLMTLQQQFDQIQQQREAERSLSEILDAIDGDC